MRARRIIAAIPVLFAAAVALASPAAANAHDEAHHAAGNAPAAAGGGAAAGAAEAALPPVVVAGGGGGGTAAANAPAPGAQPAAPGEAAVPEVDAGEANPADVEADAAGIVEVVDEVEVDEGDVISPVEVDVRPEPVPAATVDGGGTDGDGGGGANVAGPQPAAPTGDLPFTGVAENLLLVALAGMFVPIGVLLWSAARRGDLRLLRRSLAMPRFQWADPAARPFHDVDRRLVDLSRFDWTGR